MNDSVFRKVSLERLSSPEQIDQLMKLRTPSGWLIVGMFALLFAAGFVWLFAGSVPETVPCSGVILLPDGTSADAANETCYGLLYLPLADAAKVQLGQAAFISPYNVNKTEYGYLRGSVFAMGQSPVTNDDLLEMLGNERLAASFSDVARLTVLVRFEEDDDGYVYTYTRRPPEPPRLGMPCDGYILLGRRRPASLVFPIHGGGINRSEKSLSKADDEDESDDNGKKAHKAKPRCARANGLAGRSRRMWCSIACNGACSLRAAGAA